MSLKRFQSTKTIRRENHHWGLWKPATVQMQKRLARRRERRVQHRELRNRLNEPE